ncbi:MAG: divalent-cation tolerance protein CutA [Planctomycetaceae bacterium]
MSREPRLLLTTCPRESADAIAGALLERKLVACVNRIDGVQSRFWWKGALESAEETLLLLKTRADLVPGVEAALRELHPYEVFELLSFAVESGAPDYLRWLAAVTAPPEPPGAPRNRPEG